jgi:hypothetical protein
VQSRIRSGEIHAAATKPGARIPHRTGRGPLWARYSSVDDLNGAAAGRFDDRHRGDSAPRWDRGARRVCLSRKMRCLALLSGSGLCSYNWLNCATKLGPLSAKVCHQEIPEKFPLKITKHPAPAHVIGYPKNNRRELICEIYYLRVS